MVKRSERNTGTKCWRDGGVRRIVWKADGTRGVGRAVVEVEASVIVMERMWREPGRGSGKERGRVGNKLWREECGAHVHRICVWKERGTHRVVDRARKIVPFLRFTRENLSKKKIYICIRVKRSRFKIISLTCFTIFNYFRVVNARWIPD